MTKETISATFGDEALEMGIYGTPDGRVIVTRPGDVVAAKGVTTGDMISKIAGRRVLNFKSATRHLDNAARPVTIEFVRLIYPEGGDSDSDDDSSVALSPDKQAAKPAAVVAKAGPASDSDSDSDLASPSPDKARQKAGGYEVMEEGQTHGAPAPPEPAPAAAEQLYTETKASLVPAGSTPRRKSAEGSAAAESAGPPDRPTMAQLMGNYAPGSEVPELFVAPAEVDAAADAPGASAGPSMAELMGNYAPGAAPSVFKTSGGTSLPAPPPPPAAAAEAPTPTPPAQQPKSPTPKSAARRRRSTMLTMSSDSVERTVAYDRALPLGVTGSLCVNNPRCTDEAEAWAMFEIKSAHGQAEALGVKAGQVITQVNECEIPHNVTMPELVELLVGPHPKGRDVPNTLTLLVSPDALSPKDKLRNAVRKLNTRSNFAGILADHAAKESGGAASDEAVQAAGTGAAAFVEAGKTAKLPAWMQPSDSKANAAAAREKTKKTREEDASLRETARAEASPRERAAAKRAPLAHDAGALDGIVRHLDGVESRVLAALQQHAAGGAAAGAQNGQVAALEQECRALRAERDAAVERAAALEAQVAMLESGLDGRGRAAATPDDFDTTPPGAFPLAAGPSAAAAANPAADDADDLWLRFVDETTGVPFYYHAASGKTQWEYPQLTSGGGGGGSGGEQKQQHLFSPESLAAKQVRQRKALQQKVTRRDISGRYSKEEKQWARALRGNGAGKPDMSFGGRVRSR